MLVITQAWTPPDPQPYQRPLNVAPLALSYGDKPPPYSVAELMQNTLVSHPTGFEYEPRQRIRYTPIPQQGDTPPKFNPAGILQIIDSWRPPDPQPWQLPLKIAPLTLTYGDKPPPYSTAELIQNALASFPTGLEHNPSQRIRYAPIPAQGDTPPKFSPAQLFQLVDSWRPPDPAPWQHPLNFAPLTLTYGDKPPPYSVAEMMKNTLVSWPTGLEYEPRQKPLNFAPLTLTYGDQPPRYSTANFRTIIDTWRPPDPQPNQQPITVPIPAQGDRPPFRFVQTIQYDDPWPQQRQVQYPQSPVVQTYIPPPSYPWAVIQSWQTDPWPTQRPTTASLLSLVYGTQPRFSFANEYAILREWIPPDPEPRQSPPFVPIPSQGDAPPLLNLSLFYQILNSWNIDYPWPRFSFPIAAITPVSTGRGKGVGAERHESGFIPAQHRPIRSMFDIFDINEKNRDVALLVALFMMED